MNRKNLGTALLVVGALMLLTRGRGGNLFVELVWLAGFVLIATFLWRALEGRAPFMIRLAIHGAVAVVAAATLSSLAGPAFLGFLALAFWLVYRYSRKGRRKTGWALIPFGVLTTLALVAGIDEIAPRWDAGTIFLLGMTATFTLIYLLPREEGGARWALWPAVAWAAITLIANDPGGGLARWLLPLAMIGTGVAVIGWARGRGRGS